MFGSYIVKVLGMDYENICPGEYTMMTFANKVLEG